MESTCAPVVLMGYRRPEQTQIVFEAIRLAQPPVLLLIMDGAKPGDSRDHDLVEATRRVVEIVDWPCEVHRIFSDTNMGLKNRVSSGLNRVFELVENAIILEDDCVPSPSFFRYATELLNRYADDDNVGVISGSQRLGSPLPGNESYAFSKDVRIWGWATWGRTWREFVNSGELEVSWSSAQAREIGKLFAPGPRRRSMVSMMSRSTSLDSWALPFAVHCAQKGYLNPIPARNLVRNIGLGLGSTHTGFESYVVDVGQEDLSFPLRHPLSVGYTYPVDEWESQRDAKQLFTYPLKHPFDTAKRVFRYLRRT